MLEPLKLSPSAEIFNPLDKPIYVKDEDILYQPTNLMSFADAEKANHIVAFAQGPSIVVLAKFDEKKPVQILEIDGEDTIEIEQYNLKPIDNNCLGCGAPLSPLVIDDQNITHITCEYCASKNNAESKVVQLSQKALIVAITDPIAPDVIETASDLHQELDKERKNFLQKILMSKVQGLPPGTKDVLKNFPADEEIEIWHFQGYSVRELQELFCVQIGDRLANSKHKAKLSASPHEDQNDIIFLPQLQKDLFLDQRQLENGISLLTITTSDSKKLELFLVTKDNQPAELIIPSSAFKNDWEISASNDPHDPSESFYNLEEVAGAEGLLDDSYIWEAYTDSPFEVIRVQYPNRAEDDGEIPYWGAIAKKYRVPVKNYTLYLVINLESVNPDNIIIARKHY